MTVLLHASSPRREQSTHRPRQTISSVERAITTIAMVDPEGDRRGESERGDHSPRPPRLVLPEEASSRSTSPKDDDASTSQHPSGGLSPAAPAASTISTASGSPFPSRSPDTERHRRRPWETDADSSRVKEEEELQQRHQRHLSQLDQPGGNSDRAERSFSPGASAGSGPSHFTQPSAYPSLKTNGLIAPSSGSSMVKSPSGRLTASTSAAKSRKSSCELCHHRKIKVSQRRRRRFQSPADGPVRPGPAIVRIM